MFLAWFQANKEYVQARELTYYEFPTKFVYKKESRKWFPRQKGFSIGRVFHVDPGSGDLYYLRLLIKIVRGAQCHEDMRRINGVLYDIYRDACYSLGLLEDDKEYIDGIIEASSWGYAQSLRKTMSRPDFVWDKVWKYLSDDVLYNKRCNSDNPDIRLSDEQLKNHALAELDHILRKSGRSLQEFEQMQLPNYDAIVPVGNKLIEDELNYDRSKLALELETYIRLMTDEQRSVFDTIFNRSSTNNGGVFFVYGYGGTGKTFIWKSLSAALRSKGDIVLNVGSSGIASLLLPGGRTAYSRFSIPIDINEDSICNINQGTPLAQLIVLCKLIIWDEAPMMHKHCFEALDRTMRDIMRFKNPASFEQPFGGKTVVFGGDFRHILPVIPRGSRQHVVNSAINSSYIWRHVEVLKLTKNMCLRNMENTVEHDELKEFSSWVAAIGDGNIGEVNDGSATIDIPEDILVQYLDDHVAAIVNSTYPSTHLESDDLSYLQNRAILAPTNDVVDRVNQYMMGLNKKDGKRYLSSDSTCKFNDVSDIMSDVHSPEFLNGLKCSGLPNHEMILKVSTPIMLLRNMDPTAGLCNGTRLVLTKLENHVLEAKILCGKNIGDKVLIPRMSITPSDPRIPFKFQRRQFPITIPYAMTINKSQGQSLSHVGIFLSKPVFSHDQLYVAVSRVTSRSGLKILICDKDGNSSSNTQNIVYKEVFSNV